jgi:cytochrome c-type biogenesis protein CcmH
VRRTLLALAAALLLAAAPAAAAQCPQTTLGDVEDEVMCPVCGTPLGLATEAPQAQRERELIERLIADCQSKEEIKARLVAEFGDDVLAEPDDEGFDLAAWVIPGLAVLLGLLAVGAAALRWRRSGDGAAPAGPAPDSKRLDKDLERYDL